MNWNSHELLRRSVQSIIDNPPSIPWEILIVDNASADGSTDWLKGDSSRFDCQIRLLKNSENLGFGRANNQAFELSRSPLVLLLNPDTEVTPGAIDSLVVTLNSSPTVGACGPKILNSDGSLQISVWRNPPSAWEILLSQLKLYRLLPRKLRGELLLGGHWSHDRKMRVPMLSGAAMLVRRKMIDQVGGFDERFHMYGEDNEWCMRIRRAGWHLLFEPNAVIVHHGGKSSLQRWTDLQKRRVQLEASFFFQKSFLARWQVITNQLASFVVASLQHSWRRLRRVHAPEVELARDLHWKHLKQSLWDK